jgi:outer membrane protein OmpA-like peptidoglycan-associated protein
MNIFHKTILLFFFFSINSLYCIDFSLGFKTGDKIKITIRGDFSTYLNDKYRGLTSRELRSVFGISNESGIEINSSGELYNIDKTIKNSNQTGSYIDSVETCEYTSDNNGKILHSSSNYKFPFISGIPFYTDCIINPGDFFDATSDAVFDITDDLQNVRMPIASRTIYSGKKILRGREYDYFQINYGFRKPDDNRIIKATANHKVDFYFDQTLKMPVYMEDHFIEEYTSSNNDKIRRSGFFVYFYSSVEKMNRGNILHDLTSDADLKNKDFNFEKRKDGVSIIINNLQFKPDSTELLDDERTRLDPLITLLKNIPGRTFKIIGHTAKSGTEDEQMKLSIVRARRIAEFLISKGIAPERIIYMGKGAAEPVAPDDTEENMKKNRRVEIIIMED